MRTFVCTICGFVYDEAQGDPQSGASPGTRWEALPDRWACPVCGARKDAFEEQGAGNRKADSATASPAGSATTAATPTATGSTAAAAAGPAYRRREGALAASEISAICSNLARGCEKQYKAEEAGLFMELADYFGRLEEAPAGAGLADLGQRLRDDLAAAYPAADQSARGAGDRGALRALVWSEKVTRMQQSLLSRQAEADGSLLADTDVFVCDICGFIYIGDTPPDICPVCKVPKLKILKIERGA